LGLEGLGKIAKAQGQGQTAAQLFGADEALGETGWESSLLNERAAQEQEVTAARAELSDATFAAAWAAGRAMTLEQAVAEALQAGAITEGR
jgi:hypothetical protein